jgi:O-acetylhomoserine (thiol)-lyase
MSDPTTSKYRPGTLALHAGHSPDAETKSRAVPIHQTTSYLFDSTDHAADLFALKEMGWIYTRLMNPTNDVFEKRMAALEGGVGALALASGMQAVLVSLLNLATAGQHIVASGAAYGGTLALFTHTLPQMGVEVTLVDASDPANFAKAIRPETRAVFFETMANPKNEVLQYDKIVEVAHAAGVPVVCDNTVLTPMLFRPFDFGIDISVYSATKFIGGHGTSLGGVIVDSGNFDWAAEADKWPQFTQPDSSYHGLVFGEALGPLCYIAKCRTNWLRDLGGALSPFNAFLFLQGLETLHLRMERHCENALAVARFLEQHPEVEWVNYPGLPSHADYERGRHYLPNGVGSILGFGVKGGKATAMRFIESVRLSSHLANIGDAKTLVIHPASTTHSQQTPEELLAAGIGDDYLRMSVGIEDIDDITEDLDQALKAAKSNG